jgi:hypothetical protein
MIRDGSFARANYQIDMGWQFRLLRPKGFSDQPFPSIANDRIADSFSDR